MRAGRMLPLAAVAAVSVVLACDLGIGPPEPLSLTFSVADGAESEIGALLLSVAAPVEDGDAGFGRVLLHDTGPETLVAVVLGTARGSATFTLTVTAEEAPAVTVLEAVDGGNERYPNPGAFTVDVSEGGTR